MKIDSNEVNSSNELNSFSDMQILHMESAYDIKKDKEIRFTYNTTFFWGYTILIDDLRGNGPVYYIFNIDQLNYWKENDFPYHRLDQNFNVVSEGTYKFEGGQLKNEKRVFELKEGKLKFKLRISTLDKVVDIKSKFYKYKGYKRYDMIIPEKNRILKAKKSAQNYEKNRYAGYDDSDDNLNRLYKIILGNKNIKRKYLKYSKKNAVFNGEKIQTLGLAVFIDYKKELSKLTNDKNLKKISPFAWGWGYSTDEDQTVASKLKAIKKCYQDVRKKKLSLTDGECILVDLRGITGDSQNPIISENYLIKERENKILIAKNSEKSKQQIADEKKKKKDEETKKRQLLLAQKKAEEETKKQEKILAQQKKEEEKRKKELLLAQKEEDEKKKQELLLAQKKAEEERKKTRITFSSKKS